MADATIDNAQTTPSESTPTPTAPPFIPGRVRIINLTRGEIDAVFTGGHSQHLAPFSRKWDAHISEPVFRKELTPALRKMAQNGIIEIQEVTQ